MYIGVHFFLYTPSFPSTYTISTSKSLSNVEHHFRSALPQPLNDTCSITYTQLIGEAGVQEYGYCILPADNGMYLVGIKNGKTLILKVDDNGQQEWSRSFSFSSNDIRIRNAFLNSDGHIVGSGTCLKPGGIRNPYIFNYDPSSNNVIWSVIANVEAIILDILERPIQNDLVIVGQTLSNENPFFLSIDYSSGFINNSIDIEYDLASTETIVSTLVYENHIYSAGRYNFSGPTNGMRMAFSKFNMDGGQIYNKLSHIGSNQSARLYARDLVEHNGQFYVIGYGDDDGTSTNQTEMYLSLYQSDGNLSWIKKLDIPLFNKQEAEELILVSDGLVILGSDDGDGNGFYLIKTDFQGEIQWAKLFAGGGINFLRGANDQLTHKNGYIYYVGSTTSFNGDFDIFLAKVDLQGNVTDNCNIISNLNVTSTEIQNPTITDVTLSTSATNSQTTPTTVSSSVEMIPQEFLCVDTCIEICSNGIDDDGDGLIDCDDEVDCPLPDLYITWANLKCSNGFFLAEVTLCNQGQGWMNAPIVIAAYNDDPTLFDYAQIIDTFHLNFSIENGDCHTFQFEMNEIHNSLTFIVNDNGSLQPIISLDNDFPLTDSLECDYTNNLSSYSFNHQQMNLELGPDISSCSGDSVVLTTTDNWYSVLWEDGSDDPTRIVVTPGVYAITVVDSCGLEQRDSIEVSLIPPTTDSISYQVCSGSGFEIEVNGNIYNESNPSGTELLPSSNGCDSIVTISLEFNDEIRLEENYMGCSDDGFEIRINGTAYNEQHPTGIERIPGTNGCDTIIEINLQFEELAIFYKTIYGSRDEITILDISSDIQSQDSILSIEWSPRTLLSCYNCLSPRYIGENSAEYQVEISFTEGCKSIGYVSIIFLPSIEESIFIPSAFSPNNDGINDVFRPYSSADQDYFIESFEIYDRWGAKVFQRINLSMANADIAWDGTINNKPANPAVFAYMIRISSITGEKATLHGDVTLLR